MKQLRLNIKIGLRYIRTKRRNGFISFISLTSFIGIALGVMVLITVLSVMNGFEKELKERVLGMASHATVSAPDGRLTDWQPVVQAATTHPRVVGAAPYLEGQAMVTTQFGASGVLVRGINPALETGVADIGTQLNQGKLTSLQAGDFNVVIGVQMAAEYGLELGDKVNIIVPEADASIIGVMPRMKRFTVSGIFEIGMLEYDRKMLLMHIDDAGVLYKMPNEVTGVRLKVDDMFAARTISKEVAEKMDEYLLVLDWTQKHTNFFRAIQLEKTMMFFILSLIVAVAAFNIVSTMVMVVTDKESEIAILRTLGMPPKSITQIFLTQGMVIGFVGTVIGVVLGVLLALNVETIVPAIEQLFGIKFLAEDIYYISDIPSDLQSKDVVKVAVIAFVMSALATWYPARRAAKIHPAEALRYE